jgi:hypothetical protein
MFPICTARLNIKKIYVPPTQCIYLVRTEIRTSDDYFPKQHQLISFHNRDVLCLLRGRNQIFI